MHKSTPTLEAETSALREAYAAFNRNDYAAFGQLFDPQIEWNEPSDSPAGVTYRGRDAVLAHFANARANWAEGSCQPQRIIAAGDRLVQLVHVHVRLKHEADWRDGDVAEVYTFRDGKIIHARIFFDVSQGLEWAGVKPTDATAAE